MKKFLMASVAALTLSSPAMAQEFSGLRAEARVGADHVISEAQVTFDEQTESVSESRTGFTFGGEVGYDVRMDETGALGVYAGLDYSTLESCGELLGDDEACVGLGYNITAGLRATLPVRGVNVFLKGGYSRARLDVSYDDGDVALDTHQTFEGWHAGAGVEMPIGTNLYGKIEYVYTEYNDRGVSDAEQGIEIRNDLGRHNVLAGIGIRF